jgi:hypothetical protein
MIETLEIVYHLLELKPIRKIHTKPDRVLEEAAVVAR